MGREFLNSMTEKEPLNVSRARKKVSMTNPDYAKGGKMLARGKMRGIAVDSHGGMKTVFESQ